jgi:UDP-glucose 4-epimerase
VSYEEDYPKGFEDMMRRVPDISKIRNVTKWQPQKNLSDIVFDVEKYLRLNS